MLYSGKGCDLSRCLVGMLTLVQRRRKPSETNSSVHKNFSDIFKPLANAPLVWMALECVKRLEMK